MNGLILVGGLSTRMGMDKSQMVYHAKPQWQYLYETVAPFCQQTFLSCREDQKEQFPEELQLLDPYETGPLGGILSAFEVSPNEAWLVVACDMPFVNKHTFDFLLQNREKARLATAFENPITHLPEPLLAIWEPSAYSLVKETFQKDQRSPLSILKNAQVCLLECPEIDWLRNVNTAEELDKFMVRNT